MWQYGVCIIALSGKEEERRIELQTGPLLERDKRTLGLSQAIPVIKSQKSPCSLQILQRLS